MIEELSRLLSQKTSIVDINDLQKIVEIVVSAENTNEFLINGLLPITKEQLKQYYPEMSDFNVYFCQGGYDKEAKTLFVLLENLMKVANNYDGELNTNYQVAFANLQITSTILHELEHVNQEQKKEGLEGLILCASPAREPQKTYNISPRERFANIYSIIQTIDIAKRMNLPKEIISSFEKELRHYTIDQYIMLMVKKKNTGPTNEYFRINQIDMLTETLAESIEKYPDLEERLFFGLPITTKEYENDRLNVTSKSLKKYLQYPNNKSKIVK